MNTDATSPDPNVTEDDSVELLRNVALFADFADQELAKLAGRCSTRSYARGEVVWRAGDIAEDMLVVVSGELEVRGPGSHGREEVLGRIRPGECVGEMAIVLNERRSAAVVTGRQAKTLVLHKDDFADLMRDDNRLLTRLTKLLSQRAMSLARRQPVRGGPLLVGVAADPATPGASLVAEAIAGFGGEMLEGRALLIRLTCNPAAVGTDDLDVRLKNRRGLPPVIDITVGSDAVDDAIVPAIEKVIGAHGRQFGLIVIDLPPLSGRAIETAETLCNRTVRIVRDPMEESQLHAREIQVVNRYAGSHAPIPLNHCEPFVLPVEPLFDELDAEAVARAWAKRPTGASRVLGRLTRKVMGSTVGIALGGGGAFGIAHVGVLAALADAGVPIDVVAGTSMGSIIAIGHAAGLNPAEMIEIAGRIGNVRTTLSVIDPSLSGTGLLSGRRLVSIFSPLIPMDSFEDLEIPCRVVAMDVETGERVDIGSGRLDQAFRASCSIPVIFKPVQMGGRTLVDGGMIDPVPTDVVRDMGADIVVAVNVVPHLEPGVSTALSRTFKRVSRLNPFSYLSGVRNAPDLIDVFMNSLQTTEYELGNFKSMSADVLVNVDMAEFTWIDFPRALEIIERGRIAGERVALSVRDAMDERLAPLANW